MPVTNKDLVIARVFDAPIDLVWKAWSDPEIYARWIGPNDYTIPVCEIDFKVGGKSYICMRSREGKDFHCGGTYKEISPMKKIVTTDGFTDENANPVPGSYYGMEDDFPLESLVTVVFEKDNGKTRMILTHAGFPEGEVQDMYRTYWNKSFDKLEESLKVKEER